MNKHCLSAFVVGALLIGGGCEKASDTKPVVPSNPPVPAPQAATPAMGTMTASSSAGTVSVSSNAMSATATADAQKLMDQATQYIKENKWDLADSTLKQLEAMKANLPADWAPRIDQARMAFNNAKGASNLPSMPALPR